MIADDPKQWAAVPDEPAWATLNINETVRVKLTAAGLAEYRRRRKDLNARIGSPKPSPTDPKLDAEGYYSCQLWALMADFGHLMRAGLVPPFESEILLPADRLAPKS
jgi:hypothetical protein